MTRITRRAFYAQVAAPRLETLKILRVDGCRGFDDGAAAAVSAACGILEEVRFRGTRVGDAGVAALAAGIRRTLKKLTVDASGPADARRRLGDVGVAALARACQSFRVESLDLARHARLTDEGLLAVAGGLGPKLLHLIVEGCARASDLAPVALADACPLLKSLSLADCCRVSDVGALALARHPELRRACLAGTRVSAVGCAAILDHCPKLLSGVLEPQWKRSWAAAGPAVLRDVCLRRTERDGPLHRCRVAVVAPFAASGRPSLASLQAEAGRPTVYPAALGPGVGGLCLHPDHRQFRPGPRLRPGAPLVAIDGRPLDGRPGATTLAAAAGLASPSAADRLVVAAGRARQLSFAQLSVSQIAFKALAEAPFLPDRVFDCKEFVAFLLGALAARVSAPVRRWELEWDVASTDRLAALLRRAVDVTRSTDGYFRHLKTQLLRIATLRLKAEYSATAARYHASV